MKLAAVISPNGLGHFKRVFGLLDALIRQDPDIRITVFCQEWQLLLTGKWEKFQRVYHHPHSGFYLDKLKDAPRWSNDPGTYDGGSLIAWEDQLQNLAELRRADIVISDNLVGVLSHRPDTVILGSFLWSDVLEAAYPEHPEVRRFVEHERTLLERYRPYNICVGEIVMPGMQQRTRSVPMPWFGQETSRPRNPEYRSGRIALLPGATEAALRQFHFLLENLLQNTYGLLVAVPPKVRDTLSDQNRDRLEPFDFSLTAYATCDAVVCRPGIGTITDSIVTQTPMLTFYEPGNVELEHNAHCLETLGIGYNLGSELEKKSLSSVLENFLSQDHYEQRVAALAARPIDGYEQSVKWITNYKY